MPSIWPELASRVDLGLLGPLHKVGYAPADEPSLLHPSLRGQRWPNIPEKTHQPGNQGVSIPTPGVRTIHKGPGVPCLSLQEGTSFLLQVPCNHILLMSISAAPFGISTCTQDHENPRVGHREVMPPHIPKSVLCRNPWRSAPPKTEEEAGQV